LSHPGFFDTEYTWRVVPGSGGGVGRGGGAGGNPLGPPAQHHAQSHRNHGSSYHDFYDAQWKRENHMNRRECVGQILLNVLVTNYISFQFIFVSTMLRCISYIQRCEKGLKIKKK